MSSLAVFLKIQGFEVSGSDLVESENLKETRLFGVDYNIGHNKKNIENFNPNYVVINFAIHNENEELIWAKANGKKIITRDQLLGKISKKFKHVIAISGSHGKTTTTALISEIFIEAGLKPTIHIGGILGLNNSNFLIGKNKYFITEACEYMNSFHALSPDFGIVLNIEPDHLDFFKTFDAIKESFQKFIEKSRISLQYLEEYKFVLKNEITEVLYQAKNITKNNMGYSFDFYEDGKKITKFQTNFFGEHNIKNAVAAISTALFYNVKLKHIKKAIKNYHGVKRRFEKVGFINNSVIIHDYAHHPTEIKKVITQAKNYGKILTFFQPHTFSRTKYLFNDFLNSFNESDSVILLKTYPARELESDGKSAKDLFLSLKAINHKFFSLLEYAEDFKSAEKMIKKESINYDCILILGAGDIETLAKYILK